MSNLKTIKVKNINVHKISKIFCLICDIKPVKKINPKNGDLMLNYVEVVKSLAIKGDLCKVLRNVNKLYFNQKKISLINDELKEYYNLKKLKEIKNINHGIYQLLIWELFIFQYLKVYNIFDFLDINYINNLYENKEIESIKYYIEIMDYLKYEIGFNTEEPKSKRVIFCTSYIQSHMEDIPKDYCDNNCSKLFLELIKE
jgi:hypothetical protein